MEKAGVTELYVRMHCNGCAHKIRKAIRTIDGVHDINIDINRQKITVVGGADPELLVKAIKKTTKKTATVSSHTEPAASQPPSESPPAEATLPPPAEPPKDVPPTEPPKDPPPPPPPPPPPAAETPGEVQNMMHHYHPHGYVYGGHWNDIGHEARDLAPYHVMHSYNTHRQSPYVTEYVSDYGPTIATPRGHTSYDGYDGYGDGFYQNRGGGNNQMASVFSEENPNSCTIA